MLAHLKRVRKVKNEPLDWGRVKCSRRRGRSLIEQQKWLPRPGAGCWKWNDYDDNDDNGVDDDDAAAADDDDHNGDDNDGVDEKPVAILCSRTEPLEMLHKDKDLWALLEIPARLIVIIIGINTLFMILSYVASLSRR